ncbi:Disease resistance protein RML1A [Cardamine amara subsp. amara]|uniref:ADP-ribosyl cyclase/cyclic ADP-ribose hydrolase n=1 Tax=Cardamine amara subsp. amara TaxID=228776 RepID=A0ABD1C829_CARAN
MASSSSTSSSHAKRYRVFTSFHGPDVREGFLSHLHTHFESKGITTFNDQGMERGQTIKPELDKAIRESRVLIVVLSKDYASSSWCLDELVEIFNCKEAQGQTVIPIFYKVDPSDVKKQRGDFGRAFEKTCEGKSKEVKQGWSKALADVATIAGEHSINSDNEAKMIQKIATDVSEKLNATPSRDFEDMVGLEAHLRNLYSLLHLESDDVKMIGIWGPAGIGKTTISRALYNQLSSSFQLSCFMGNLKGSCKSTIGVDGHKSQLSLQNQLLSEILDQKDMRVYHLGAIKEWLHDQRVLIVLDDVDDLEQLEVLAKELSWFGSGSRIIVTTEDKQILKAHGIHNIYHMDFPSKEEALEMLCRSAFKQSSVPDGFEELANKVAEFCGYLPLGLSVVGSSLRGQSKHEWELQLSRIETSLDRKTENILRVGYDRLLKEDQSLFLHIACFFNNDNVDHVSSLLADSHDVEIGLKTLAEKSLVHTNGSIVMHYLLQKLGIQIVRDQSDEPGKRKFLLEVKEIRDVLENETGTGSVIGISLDKSTIGNDHHVSVGKRAFEGMRNLRLLRIYENPDHLVEEARGLFMDILAGKVVDFSNARKFGAEAKLQIPEDMEYLSPLTLFHWDFYPGKSLPPGFQPDRLVELHMPFSNLEKLWGGIERLPNLKSIDLNRSQCLKEIPNLLNATNLETLNLEYCLSLVELPSSIRNLHKLKKLKMDGCKKLRDIPTNINLASLEEVEMTGCSQLSSFPDFSMNIRELRVGGTKIEEIPSSIRNLHKLELLNMYNCQKLRVIPTNINLPSLEVFSVNCCSRLASFPDISSNITKLDLGNTKIKDVPTSVVRCWSRLEWLDIGSRSLERLTHVPPSVRVLHANGCVSLKRVCCSFPNETKRLSFYNCIQLDEESRRRIIQQSIQGEILLPGKEIPAEFTHKATGNSITIPLASGTFSASSRFKACILLSPIEHCLYQDISCRLRSKGDGTIHSVSTAAWLSNMPSWSKHLFIFSGDLFPQQNRCHEVDVTISEITFEFSCGDDSETEDSCDDKIIECGVEIMTEEAEGSSSSQVDTFETEISKSQVDNFETEISSSSEVEYDGGNNTDGDGDEDNEAEGFNLSQDENIKTSKDTGFRSWLRKLGLKRKR